VSDALDVLRRECCFEAAPDATVLLQSVSRADRRGSATVVLLDEDRRLVDLLMVDDGGDELLAVVRAVCEALIPDVTDMLLVTDRSGETPCDRPDDELVWMELVELTDSWDITLLDWFVVSGRYSFSVAEFAPTPAQW
jgi:hypothetical protein